MRNDIKLTILFDNFDNMKRLPEKEKRNFGLTNFCEAILLKDSECFSIDYEQLKEGHYGYLANDCSRYIDDVFLVKFDTETMRSEIIMRFITTELYNDTFSDEYQYALFVVADKKIKIDIHQMEERLLS